MKVLLLDLESSPNTAHVWGLWEQNIGLNQLMESSYVLCWAAKWLGEKPIHFDSLHRSSAKKMLRGIHDLLHRADTVIHYNGTKFDIPTLNKEFILHGMDQPAPYRQMDLLQVARRQFKFASNRLDYVAQALGVGRKTRHEGHELWVKCMNNDPQAWKKMERYNKNDVVIMEKVYYKLRPWMKGHTNYALYVPGIGVCCPRCGADHSTKQGFAYTSAGKYQQYQCKACQGWFRSSKNLVKGERYLSV